MNINENLKNTLMVDIETTGTAPGCKVLTIGAFGYTPAGKPVEFYERLDIKELDKDGFEDDMSTISWWKKQSDAARSEAFGGKAYPKTAFKKFSDFVSENFDLHTFYNPFQVWSCGIDFDFPILKEAAEFYGQPLPWKFWQQYDYRTLKNLFGLKAFENNTAAHTALEDCKAQMRGLQAFRNLIIDKDAKIARLEAEIDTSRTAMKAMTKENS